MANPLGDVRQKLEAVTSRSDDLQAVEQKLLSLEDSLKTLRDALLSNRDGELSVLAQQMLLNALDRAAYVADEAEQQHRNLHRGVSRVGKSIDRTMVRHILGLLRNERCLEKETGSQRLMEGLLCDYFVYTGFPDVAAMLDREANLGNRLNADIKNSVEIKDVMEAMEDQNVEPALKWLEENQPGELRLRCDLIKQLAVEHIKNDKCSDALAAARRLADLGYEKDTAELVGAIIRRNDPKYSDIFSPVVWPALMARLAQIIYSTDSSIEDLVEVGTRGVCALMVLRRRMGDTKEHLFNGVELPCAVSIPRAVHNTFTCPVLRTQSTETNPPMRLRCGHVISRDALTKLASTTRHYKVKCPYCPDEGTQHEAKMIQF